MTSGSDQLAYEKDYEQEGFERIAGVDEAGRGPLAGPVCAAAVILPSGVRIEGVNDSKKLTEKKREKLFDIIREKALAYAIEWGSVEEIERVNILQATMNTMKRAVEGLKVSPDIVLIDGNKAPELSVPHKTIVKGDAVSQSIAAASILAKVSRDRLMLELAKQYPEYQFEKHKGYGTKLHQEMILKYGASDIHRKSFLKKLLSPDEKPHRTRKKIIGDLGEETAAEMLRKKGYTIIERNYRCKAGEIDIIAKNDSLLLIVEVKTRTPKTREQPADAVDKHKEDKLTKAAENYLASHPYELPVRMDIVEVRLNDAADQVVDVHHIENAF